MAIIKCPTCGQPISDKAVACPKCGEKVTQSVAQGNTSDLSHHHDAVGKSDESLTPDPQEVVIPPIPPIPPVAQTSPVSPKQEIVSPPAPAYNKEPMSEKLESDGANPPAGEVIRQNQLDDTVGQSKQSAPVYAREEYYEYQKPKKKSKAIFILIPLLLILLIFLGGGIYGWFYYENVYLPKKIDMEAPRTYPIVNLFLRSSKMAGGDFNKITTIPYGAELLTYDEDGEWATVKYITPDGETKPFEGFVASEYLLNKKDFYLINSILGDNDAKEVLATSKVRRGLIDYFNSTGKTGRINPEQAEESGLEFNPQQQWQVLLEKGQDKPNEVLFKRVYNADSKFTDMAVLIKNLTTGKKKLLFFTYDDDETPIFRGETDFYGNNIKDMVINRDYWGTVSLVVIDDYNNRHYLNFSE